jgi:hypothetical protein
MTLRMSRLLRAAHREDGTATVEFVIVFPLLLIIFLMAFESGMVMIRNIMLERSVDMVMRELRLSRWPNPTHDQIKDEICKNTVVFPGCRDMIIVNLQPVDMVTWDIPDDEIPCIDRAQNLNPAPVWSTSDDPHQVMLVRACITVSAMFPTTGIGLNLVPDGSGDYWLTAVSAFVNEPAI